MQNLAKDENEIDLRLKSLEGSYRTVLFSK
ncbi:hypothetical protein FLGE108171_00205 [Flavobacterium gelidilacus]|jgi:hypothetical protein